MSKLFKVWPKKPRNTNSVIISPAMEVIVTTKSHTGDPFYNGAVEVKEAYMRLYGVDLKKGCYTKGDFEVQVLG
ncbi:MAG: DUF6140 family protein [Paludibacter sp.]|nr:DUF6140 family protein [Paludibacter sp.]